MTYKTERLLVGFKPCLRDGKFDFDNCCSDKKVDLLNLQPSDDCENMVFQLYLKEDNMNIGHISLYNKYGKLEVAYETNALFRGKGYMTEALTFAVKWIFDNTTEDSIWALIEDDNMHSIKHFQKFRNTWIKLTIQQVDLLSIIALQL